MRAGELDRRITILGPTVIDDPEYGLQPGPYEAIVNGVRIPAKRMDDRPSNAESVGNGLRLSYKPGVLYIRYRKDIRSDMRVVMHDEDDKLYEMSSEPAEIGRREWLEISIKEYSTNGS